MNDIEISIAKDFSKIPGARHPEEGSFSGQEFRESLLFPKIKDAMAQGVSLIVDLDGTAGLGTSFLEESFGGLIRENKLDYFKILDTLILVSEEDDEYKEEISGYLKAAYEQINH